MFDIFLEVEEGLSPLRVPPAFPIAGRGSLPAGGAR